jgi:hypothetical protein
MIQEVVNSAFLIKRNPAFSNNGFITKKPDGKKGYSEILIASGNKEPYPKELKIGDLIFVAENESGIYAKGEVIEVCKLKIFENVNQIIEFAQKSKDEKFWMTKLIKFNEVSQSKPGVKLYFKEYFINQSLLKRTIPLSGALSRLSKKGLAASIIKLNEDEVNQIESPIFVNTSKLNEKIPSSLRLDLYSFFNKNYKVSHWIDIDHFVPQSAGGPGNIIENLVPIGFSLNRYKSDSIPRGFFIIANSFPEFQDKIDYKWMSSSSEFLKIKDFPKSKEVCLYINGIIQDEWQIEDAKKFYKDVLLYHDSNYVEIIEQFNKV